MHRTQRLRPVETVDAGRHNVPALVSAALVLTAAVCGLIVLQPGLGHQLTALWSLLALPNSRGPLMTALVAAGVAVGGAALGVAVLSAFVRGVQAAPYLWLSPVLVGFGALVIARLHVQLPGAVMPISWFAALSALMLLGGGAVAQLRGVMAKAAGLLLASAPLLVLVAGYAEIGAWSSPTGLELGARLLLFVLTVTFLGVVFLALATHAHIANSTEALSAAMRGQRQQVQLALLRMRQSDARAQAAEQRASIAQERAAQSEAVLAQDAEFLAQAKPAYLRWALPVGCALGMALCAGAAYAQLYAPLTHRLAAAETFIVEAKKTHEAEMASLRERALSEKQTLTAAAEAERVRAEQALAVTEAARMQLAAYAAAPAQLTAADAKTAKTAKTTDKTTATLASTLASKVGSAKPVHLARAHKAAPARHARASSGSQAHTRAEAATTSEAAVPAQANHRPANDDDPIAGLDGI